MTETKSDSLENDLSYNARRAILDGALRLAAFEGWTDKTLREATAKAQLPKGAEALYFPDGVLELISFWGEELNHKVDQDLSTDANYYSKRTILSAVISSSLVAWVADTSADKADGRAFIEARIANVMQFEKAKWALKKRTENLPNPAEFLGQLRYGMGRASRRRRRSGRWN